MDNKSNAILENIPKTSSLKSSYTEVEQDEYEVRKKRTNQGRLYEESGVPTRHELCVVNTNKDWIAGYEELLNILGSGMTAALIGQRGTGKTQMAVELIRHACFQEITSRYKMTMDFFMDLKESYDNKAIITESEIIKAYISPQLLVLDEIHERGDSSWENRLMTHMINKRYGAMKDTVLISNQTPEVFGKSIGNSILSRLNETGAIIVCNWESFRK